MKFLVKALSNDKHNTLPPKTRMELMEGEVTWIEKCLWGGNCIDSFSANDGQCTLSIWESGSSEKLTNQLRENPMSPFMNYEIKPIVKGIEFIYWTLWFISGEENNGERALRRTVSGKK